MLKSMFMNATRSSGPRRHRRSPTRTRSRRACLVAAVAALIGSPTAEVRAETLRLVENARDVPTLAGVISLVKGRAPEVLIENANVAVARSELVGARLPAIQNPYLELTAEYGATGSTQRFLSASGTVWVPFEVGGQRSRRIRVAGAGVQLQREVLHRARALAVGDAMAAFGQSVVGVARLRVLDELEAVARAEAETYRARFHAGDATVQEARFAEVEQARYEVMKVEASADLTRALEPRSGYRPALRGAAGGSARSAHHRRSKSHRRPGRPHRSRGGALPRPTA
jgi:hypothetical protein